MSISELLGDSSPVAVAAREAARKEYLGGAKSPSEAILRVASLFGREWVLAYLDEWKRLRR